MRKWFIILLSVTGITVVIILGWQNPISRNPGISDRFAGLSETSGRHEQEPPQITIEVVVSVDGETMSNWKQATERFEYMRPNVQVNIKNVTFHELVHTYRHGLLSGEGPEVLLYPTSWVRHEAAAGRLRSLDNYVTLERQSQWFETVRGAVRWNGYLWAVPLEWNPYVFVIDADEGEKLADLLSAPAASVSGRADYGMALLAAMNANGVEAVAAEEEALHEQALQADSKEILPADENIVLSGDLETAVEALAAVASGEAAGAFVPLSEAVRAAEEHPEANLAVYMPEAEQLPPAALPPFLGHSFIVSPTADDPVEAAEWILFVTDPSGPSARQMEGPFRWPVYRAMYGLPSTYEPEIVRAVPLQNGGMPAVRAVMRLLDQMPVIYGDPPAELPNL